MAGCTRTAALAAAFLATGAANAADVPVDLGLILAVDVSRSVDPDEAFLQRDGYVRAFSDRRLIAAIEGGAHGRIAVIYVEWAGWGQHWQRTAWTVVGDAKSADDFATALAALPLQSGHWTSIASAVEEAVLLFEDNGFAGDRRVIDVSGDGPNNVGGNVALARQDAVARGVTINGLPIVNRRDGHLNIPDLDVYYRECVIGGPGAFAVVAEDFVSFGAAVLRKLILEIAGLQPAAGIERYGAPRVIPVQNAGSPEGPYAPPARYAPECDVGERLRELYMRPFLLP